MTEPVHTKQYGLRLTARHVIYDPDRGSHIWREWPEGAIVTDSDDIKLLEAHGALTEKVEADE